MIQFEMVMELREFLAEHIYTCFHTNYYFEHAGVRLNEFSELRELDLAAEPLIYMKEGKSPFALIKQSFTTTGACAHTLSGSRKFWTTLPC